MVFYNLPSRCTIRIYTLAGDPVALLQHDQSRSYNGSEVQWYADYADDALQTRMAGGEHVWDLLSESKQAVQAGIYLFQVEDRDSDRSFSGRFVVLR
jgi:hypothetical protein